MSVSGITKFEPCHVCAEHCCLSPQFSSCSVSQLNWKLSRSGGCILCSFLSPRFTLMPCTQQVLNNSLIWITGCFATEKLNSLRQEHPIFSISTMKGIFLKEYCGEYCDLLCVARYRLNFCSKGAQNVFTQEGRLFVSCDSHGRFVVLMEMTPGDPLCHHPECGASVSGSEIRAIGFIGCLFIFIPK